MPRLVYSTRSMERIQARGVSKEEYTRNFKIKQHEVPKIENRPTWTSINRICKAIETNLINSEEIKHTYLIL